MFHTSLVSQPSWLTARPDQMVCVEFGERLVWPRWFAHYPSGSEGPTSLAVAGPCVLETLAGRDKLGRPACHPRLLPAHIAL